MPHPDAGRPSPRPVAARLAAIALLAMVALLTTATSSSAHEDHPTKRCSVVSFTPNSDDMAANVRATHVTCAFARDLISDSKGHPARRYRGFRCGLRRVEEATLPYTRHRCVRGAKTITWDRY